MAVMAAHDQLVLRVPVCAIKPISKADDIDNEGFADSDNGAVL